jgi:hypothetical protein
MNVTTKYNIGDTVWCVAIDHCERLMACETCDDTKQVNIKGDVYKCPNCVTNQNNKRWRKRFFVRGSGKVGRVTYEHTEARWSNDNSSDDIRRTYMIDSTGVGSGSVWDEATLFPTKEEAQAYCDAENERVATYDQ